LPPVELWPAWRLAAPPGRAQLEPERGRYAYVYAVALHSAGRGGEAVTVPKESLAQHPGDRDTLLALISFNRDAGDFVTALEYAEQLARIPPADPSLGRFA